jgi:ATP-dependent Clp protease ATP-binding subunit ClpC
MEFLTWHYSKGLEFYINWWLSYFNWINNYFSLALLIKTLFAPWKRLIEVDTSPGFNIKREFETLMFNIISRVMGAIVRFILFWVGIVLIFMTFLGGIFGMFFWVAFPFFGIPVYTKHKKQPAHFTRDLLFKIRSSHRNSLELLFSSEAGRFVLDHTGLSLQEVIQSADMSKVDFSKINHDSFTQVIKSLTEQQVWSGDFYRQKGISAEDMQIAAFWWEEKRYEETDLSPKSIGKSGIGTELMYGYTPTLNQYSSDLSTPQPYSHRLIGREDIVSRMERSLSAGNSICLIGQPGVGKKTVVLEFARRAASGELGPKMAFKRVLEFDYNFLLSGSMDLNSKKANLAQIFEEASSAGNIILMIRDIQRLINPDVEGYDFTDIFEKYLSQKELKIIAVSTNTDYERFISSNMRVRKHLHTVDIIPPSKEQAMEILVEAARVWESRTRITILVPALRKILDESDRYITEVPFPEKVLELLDILIEYQNEKGEGVITVNDANTILAERTGVSFSALTESEKGKLSNLEDIIHEKLIDQEVAVSLIAKSLRAKTLEVAKGDRPIGSFLFLGPTGVGKTQTAKVLAEVYYGSRDNILRFDMAEYSGSEGFERLIGSVLKNQPGTLTTAIKNKPASLLLMDEFEKSTRQVYNLLLPLLDEGVMTDAFGNKINARHLFVICTSNAAAEFIRKLVEKDISGAQLQKQVVEHILSEGHFSPELINRFDGVVVFKPLSGKDLEKVARLILKDFANNLEKKGVRFVVTDQIVAKLAKDGYEPAFGARPMRRIVDLVLGDLVGKAMLDGKVKEGDTLEIIPGTKKDEYSLHVPLLEK